MGNFMNKLVMLFIQIFFGKLFAGLFTRESVQRSVIASIEELLHFFGGYDTFIALFCVIHAIPSCFCLFASSNIISQKKTMCQ